jgi:hypothetical protein
MSSAFATSRDNWKACGRARILLDVALPFNVLLCAVNRQANDFGPARRPLVGELSDCSKLRRANGREVFGVAKENGPAVTYPVVQIERT